jgi:hypothetical protein
MTSSNSASADCWTKGFNTTSRTDADCTPDGIWVEAESVVQVLVADSGSEKVPLAPPEQSFEA